ncbi:hypothetical protein GCM10009125_28780 [Castellaniella daejeonensis]|uniref:Uncharacterized protein n=1 Tax=Castellaniella daejeonensis TaxID=659013 RepID=A0ABN0U4Q2_9BURK
MGKHNHKYNDQGAATYMDRGSGTTTVDGVDVTSSTANFQLSTIANGSYIPTTVASAGGVETRGPNTAILPVVLI